MTIMEEANEFIDRVKNGGKLPIITSCSPGWVKFCEHYFPSLTENLSTCKSPQQMTGALIKRGLRKEKASIRTTSFLFPSCRASRRNSRSTVTTKTQPVCRTLISPLPPASLPA